MNLRLMRLRRLAGSAAAGAVGAVATRLALRAVRPLLCRPVFERTNARGVRLPTAGGIAPMVVAPLLAGSVALVAKRHSGVSHRSAATPAAVAVAAAGCGALGLIDDLWGDVSGDVGTRGLGGHVGALRSGRVTTGAVKLIGAPAVGLITAALIDRSCFRSGDGSLRPSAASTVVAAAVVALGANVANLFDRAPGRCLKVVVLAGVPTVVAVGRRNPSAAAAGAAVVGAALAMAPDDLGERVMLGDAGAGLVGGALAASAVAGASTRARVGICAVLLALTVSSERWSFTTMIRSNAVLRMVDDLGRRT